MKSSVWSGEKGWKKDIQKRNEKKTISFLGRIFLGFRNYSKVVYHKENDFGRYTPKNWDDNGKVTIWTCIFSGVYFLGHINWCNFINSFRKQNEKITEAASAWNFFFWTHWPSLKLTAKGPENWWLEDQEKSKYWVWDDLFSEAKWLFCLGSLKLPQLHVDRVIGLPSHFPCEGL